MAKLVPILHDQEPGDGLRVRAGGLSGGSHWLSLVFYAAGERFAPVQGLPSEKMLKLWEERTEKTVGESQRLRMLAEAVARFLNSGGSYTEIHETLLVFQQFVPGGRDLFGGYYVDAILNTDGAWEHLFAMAPKSEQVVRWVEDTFIDVFPRAELDVERELERGSEESPSGSVTLLD